MLGVLCRSSWPSLTRGLMEMGAWTSVSLKNTETSHKYKLFGALGEYMVYGIWIVDIFILMSFSSSFLLFHGISSK